jgi:predicted secreted protein
MTVVGGMALYFVIWWTVLFVVLPFGVRSQAEDGTVIDGTEPGAPVLPGLLRKAAITSVIAGLVFALVWYVWATFDL